MMRTVMAVASGLLCGAAGLRHAAMLRRDAANVKRWEALLRTLALLLGESSLSLPDALLQAASDHQGPDKVLRSLASGMLADPLADLPELYAALPERPLSGAAGAALDRMMPRLSRGTLESRVLAVTQTADELALTAAQTGEHTLRDAKMWSRLGWTFGACLTLLLI